MRSSRPVSDTWRPSWLHECVFSSDRKKEQKNKREKKEKKDERRNAKSKVKSENRRKRLSLILTSSPRETSRSPHPFAALHIASSFSVQFTLGLS